MATAKRARKTAAVVEPVSRKQEGCPRCESGALLVESWGAMRCLACGLKSNADRFTFTRLEPGTRWTRQFEAMRAVVDAHPDLLQEYHADFYAIDRDWLADFQPENFVWIIRRWGTHLYRLPTKDLSGVAYCVREYPEALFYVWTDGDAGTLREIKRQRAAEIGATSVPQRLAEAAGARRTWTERDMPPRDVPAGG